MTENQNTPDAAAQGSVPAVVGVLGGGRMGGGIAHAFLVSGASEVVVVERDPQSAEAAKERIEADLAKSLERGKLDGNLDVWAERLTVSVDRADFARCDLVIEAVFEDMKVKIEALTDVEKHLREDAWLASNTSSLSIDEIAGSLQR
ncbi:3-hydroxyacyl-CoA dehydrogenase family protein, partial [Micrococcus endophyticus]|uniref:3-hydroxyacyl-CoA dehydrogenase family protein n=1 Tax=Micrococcus endophyticus TaxID=455343 RepID=UPI0034CD48C2